MKIIDFIKKLTSPHADNSYPESDNNHSNQRNQENDIKESACDSGLEPKSEPVSHIENNSMDSVIGYQQIGFFDFTTEKGVIGFYLNPDNRWLQLEREVFSPEMEIVYLKRLLEMRDTTKSAGLASRLERLSQDDDVAEYGRQLTLSNIDAAVEQAIEDSTVYKRKHSNAGRDPFPFRLVFGILIAQAILNLSDRGICKLVSESPYLQKFLGYTSFSDMHTIHPSNLVNFRKRLDVNTMQEMNEIVHRHRSNSGEYASAANARAIDTSKKCESIGASDETDNCQSNTAGKTDFDSKPGGVLILDATCGPVNIRFPQDYSLLNEARLDLEGIINGICKVYNFTKPRTYVRILQQEATNLSKSKKKSEEAIRRVIKLELNAVKRNLEYIDGFLGDKNYIKLFPEEIERIQVIRAIYAQQKYMYDLKTHRVSNRIVSISLPFIRPINRGKVNKPTEFGPKYDIAVDENGFTWLTNFSFDNFSESTHLQDAVEQYRKTTGHYPERILVDQIYRTAENRKYCKQHNIRISGPPLGRRPLDDEVLQELISVEKQDMIDRISVERHFSREKRCFGIEKIVEKTEETIGHAVGMSVFLDNVVPVGF